MPTEPAIANDSSKAIERRFRTIFHSQVQFIGLMSLDGILLEANRTALAAAGVTEDSVIGLPFWQTAWWTHDAVQQDRLRDGIARASRGEPVRFEASHPTADGRMIWVDFSISPFFGDDGRVEYLIPEGHDITARKRAENALRVQEERFRAAMEGSLHAVYFLAAERNAARQITDFVFTDLNRKGHEMISRRREEVVGQRLCELLPVNRTDGIFDKYVRVVETGEPLEEEFAMKPRDGIVANWLHHQIVRVGDGVTITSQDVTARKQAKAAMLVSEERFRNAFEHAPIGMAMVALDGRWLRVNPSVCEIVGYTESELLATDFQTITHPDDLNADLHLLQSVLAGAIPSYHMEKRYFHKDGRIVHIMLSVSLVRDPAGTPLYFISQIQDITLRKQAEERMRASLLEKELLLKEIHHRVKNNLQIVSSLLDLQSDHTTDAGALVMFQESRSRVKSMALIHERLYRSLDMASVNIGEYVRQLADDLYRTYKISNFEIALELDIDIPAMTIDIAIPCGLLLNELISNCLKHAFKNSSVGIIRVSFVPDNEFHVLTVADNGAGFPATTDFRNTTSFGLQLVNMLVEQLDGRIEHLNDGGTAFTIRFPKPKSGTSV